MYHSTVQGYEKADMKAGESQRGDVSRLGLGGKQMLKESQEWKTFGGGSHL